MTKTEKITILISLFAVCFSVCSFLFQQFYKPNKIIFSLVKIKVGKKLTEGEMVVANIGKQKNIINFVELILYVDDEKFFSKSRLCEQEPIDALTLKPQEIEFIKLYGEMPQKSTIGKDTINIALLVTFITENGGFSKKILKLGEINDDSPDFQNLGGLTFNLTQKGNLLYPIHETRPLDVKTIVKEGKAAIKRTTINL